MAEAKRRGYAEDGIYFDHRGDCRDGDHHKTCSGRWRGWSRSHRDCFLAVARSADRGS
jgi:hypothetical protein